MISGRVPDWALGYASIGYLHKAAYLTGDGRWLEYLNRARIDTDCFRLGQSYWPDASLRPAMPTDLAGEWQVNSLPEPLWKARNNGFPHDESYLFMSYRTDTDASGDFILLDGFNGESRNPYHTFAILELRTAGTTLLEGYLNQLLTRMDGMVEPEIAKDAALRHRNALGQTAVAIGEVPDAAYTNWRRAVVQRIGKHTVIVDSLTPRADSENFEVQILWQAKNGAWKPDGTSRVRLAGGYDASTLPQGWREFPALDAECTSHPAGPTHMAKLTGLGVMLLRATEPGHWIEMAFETTDPIEGEAFIDFLNYRDRGIVRITLDGTVVSERYDHHAPTAQTVRHPIGVQRIESGRHTLRVEVIDGHETSNSGFVALGGLRFKETGAGEPPEAVVAMSEPSDISQGRGAQVTMEWLGPVRKGQPKHFVSVVAEQAHGQPSQLDAVALNAQAAAVALPEPGLVVRGDHEGIVADTAVLTESHIYGLDVVALADLLKSDTPIEIDWDLEAGVLKLEANQAARIVLACADPDAVRLDGEAVKIVPSTDGTSSVASPAGRHLLTGVHIAESVQARLARDLESALRQARDTRTKQQAASEAAAPPAVSVLDPAARAQVGGEVVYLDVATDDKGSTVYAVEGDTIHVLDAALQPVRTLKADGTVRMVRWWPEHRLLLAGCADEKVIAFDETGQRKWVFVSEMHPDVFRAAKTYWFKSAPGHEGIHGLHT
ncbi:MAG: hypothetical protein GY851_11430, partial [bacterium]|nr:hypothetical protein [bacterium]